MKKQTVNPSAAQTQAQQLSTSDAANRDKQIAGANASQAAAGNTLAGTAPTLNRITAVDPTTGQTALRTALQNSMTTATNKGFNNSLMASRARAAGNGLAGQPVAQGGDMAIEAQRASALGAIPGQVEQQATQEELQAAGLQNQQAGLYTGLANSGIGAASQYNPNAPLSTEAQLEENRAQQQLAANQAQGGLWKGLAKVGLAAASPFTGGATGAIGRSF